VAEAGAVHVHCVLDVRAKPGGAAGAVQRCEQVGVRQAEGVRRAVSSGREGDAALRDRVGKGNEVISGEAGRSELTTSTGPGPIARSAASTAAPWPPPGSGIHVAPATGSGDTTQAEPTAVAAASTSSSIAAESSSRAAPSLVLPRDPACGTTMRITCALAGPRSSRG
jgi:hypothetical protein